MKRTLLLFGGKFDFDIILMLEVICLKKVRATDPVLEYISKPGSPLQVFPNFHLPIMGCCLSASAAYTPVFSVSAI